MFPYARIYWLAEFGAQILTAATDPSKCINDHTLRSDTEVCRTLLLKVSDKCPTKLSDKILPGRSESLHSQIVYACFFMHEFVG
jgi:hypothetical protein